MQDVLKTFFEIYDEFPMANNWQKYLRLKNWKKLYFTLFIKKYWLDWWEVEYWKYDVLRRIRMVEFFKYITTNFDVLFKNWRFLIETKFFRMVIIETKKQKLELLSFYNFK